MRFSIKEMFHSFLHTLREQDKEIKGKHKRIESDLI